MFEPSRRAWAEVDLGAIRDNATALATAVAPAELCAVVKADAYGHGAVPVALAALRGGATRLAVALVEEGRQLREAGIDVPILVLSEPSPSAMSEVVASNLTPTLYSLAGVEAAADAVFEQRGVALKVHVKVDTGMHRVGATPEEALSLLHFIRETEGLEAEGLFTHFAVADDPSHHLTAEQADKFTQLIGRAAAEDLLPPIVHASNSAAGLRFPELRFSMVRCGIALYGLAPSPHVTLPPSLRPALTIRAAVSFVKHVEAGSAISYGQEYVLAEESTIATVPVGYADGLPMRLAANGGQVLIDAKRFQMAGKVTMDQFMVDCGKTDVAAGDEVVIIGTQGDEAITADEIADRMGTINYEIVCRLGPRLPRIYVGRLDDIDRRPSRMSGDLLGDSILADDDPIDPFPKMQHLH